LPAGVQPGARPRRALRRLPRAPSQEAPRLNPRAISVASDLRLLYRCKPFAISERAEPLPRLVPKGIFLGLVLLAAPALGEDRKVYSPYVEAGVFELEARGNRTIDGDSAKNDQQTHLYETSYGVNDWWYTALFGRLEKEPGEDFRYAATAWENIFQL